MRHLVQVVPYYNPPHVGGMEMRARDRAERLSRLGWQVETLTSSEQTRPHVVTDGNLVVRYLRSREVAHTPIMFALPLALARVPAGSVIQVETAIAFAPEITALMCKLRGLAYIARVPLDTSGHTKLRDALLALYKKTVLAWVYRNAGLVIVLTPDDVATMTRKYGVAAQRIRVIPNATSFAPITAPRRAGHDPLRLLFAGRVAIQKNLPLLLRSLRHYVGTYGPAVHLDLVGDGEDMPLIRKMIDDLSLTSLVTLHGYVTGPDLERAYERADAFVMTSTNESFPQVLLEAMAKGLPVVAGDIQGVRTVVDDGVTGLLVDLTPDSFADAFHRLVTERALYADLSAGALKKADQYSWDATIDGYQAAYAELLDGERGDGRLARR